LAIGGGYNGGSLFVQYLGNHFEQYAVGDCRLVHGSVLSKRQDIDSYGTLLWDAGMYGIAVFFGAIGRCL